MTASFVLGLLTHIFQLLHISVKTVDFFIFIFAPVVCMQAPTWMISSLIWIKLG